MRPAPTVLRVDDLKRVDAGPAREIADAGATAITVPDPALLARQQQNRDRVATIFQLFFFGALAVTVVAVLLAARSWSRQKAKFAAHALAQQQRERAEHEARVHAHAMATQARAAHFAAEESARAARAQAAQLAFQAKQEADRAAAQAQQAKLLEIAAAREAIEAAQRRERAADAAEEAKARKREDEAKAEYIRLRWGQTAANRYLVRAPELGDSVEFVRLMFGEPDEESEKRSTKAHYVTWKWRNGRKLIRELRFNGGVLDQIDVK